MQRILFWLALILLINWWWRKNSRALAQRMRDQFDAHARGQAGSGRPAGQRPHAPPPQAVADQVEPMACCAQCSTYVPISEAISVGARHFCCAEHARQFASHAA
jgi:uncharacterized protein